MSAQATILTPSTESHAPLFLRALSGQTSADFARLRPSAFRTSSKASTKGHEEPKESHDIKDEENVQDVEATKEEPVEDKTENKVDPKVEATVSSIMEILETFSLHQKGNDEFLGRDSFSSLVREHVEAKRSVPMVLPAFPFKSINKEEKVIGTKPDLGEELALDRLNDLCQQIRKVHEPGAHILIAPDGACYNDLLDITDDDLWDYGVTLRKMVDDKGYSCISFIRFMELLGFATPDEEMTKERFVELLEPSRKALMERYGQGVDPKKLIQEDDDYMMTYRGYSKFLEKDLAFSSLREPGMSGTKWKGKVRDTAKTMIGRGVVSFPYSPDYALHFTSLF
jgi:pyoverdine/dityrosine biosynthesis protein Dit1